MRSQVTLLNRVVHGDTERTIESDYSPFELERTCLRRNAAHARARVHFGKDATRIEHFWSMFIGACRAGAPLVVVSPVDAKTTALILDTVIRSFDRKNMKSKGEGCSRRIRFEMDFQGGEKMLLAMSPLRDSFVKMLTVFEEVSWVGYAEYGYETESAASRLEEMLDGWQIIRQRIEPYDVGTGFLSWAFQNRCFLFPGFLTHGEVKVVWEIG